MATLTQSFQRIAETAYTAGNARGVLALYGKYDSQNTIENYSTISFQLRTYTTSGSFYSSQNSAGLNCGGDRGNRYFNIGNVNGNERTIAAWAFNVSHTTDGYYNGSVSAWADVYAGSVPSVSTSFSLPRIKRQAIITGANDFVSDTQNPSMTYTFYDGVNFQVNAYLEVNGTRFKTIEDIGNVGTITFELTNQEWTDLVTMCQAPSMTVRYGVATLINSQTENAWSYLDRTMTINDIRKPLVSSIQFADTNATVNAWKNTHSYSNLYVYNASTIQFSGNVRIDTTTQLEDVKLIDTSNDKIVETQKYTGTGTIAYSFTPILLEKVINNYKIQVTDKRTLIADGRTASLNTFEPYLRVAINNYTFKRQNPTSSNVIFNGDFTYWGDIHSTNDNIVTIKYKLDSGNWVTIPSSNYSIDGTNHKLTINNYTISNILNYRQKGQFSISIEDELTNKEDTSNNGLVLKGVPTFDAGEHDLKVNGTLYIADEDGDNAINVEEELNKGDTYSTSEVKTKDIWIDGKPIYRKEFDIGSISANVEKSVSTGLATNTIDNILRMEGYIKVNFGIIPTGFTNDGYKTCVYYNESSNALQIVSETSASNGYIILEYTKTTD